MFRKIIRKSVVLVFLLSLIVWLLLRFVFTDIFPREIIQSLFYWELLYLLLIARLYWKVGTYTFFYSSLVILTLGATFSITGISILSEFILRSGFVVFMFGLALTLIGFAKGKAESND